MSITLSALIKPFCQISSNDADTKITGLQNDSRKVVTGDVFMAYPGAVSDGRQYIQQAIKAGAVAILYEPDGASLSKEHFATIPLIAISSLNEKLAAIASRFYGNPSSKLSITGVTGTNGKTTIAYQLTQAYELLGKSAAYIGTLGQGKIGTFKTLGNTTPDGLCLQNLLYLYVKEGIQHVCMEVSSHALSLGRVNHVDFSQAIYTNLSLDHLDFHQTMAAYAHSKALLFSKSTLKTAIINQDDEYNPLMQQQLSQSCQLLTYGLTPHADIHALKWETSMSGTRVEFDSAWGKHTLQLQSLGKFNVYNSLAVFASLMASGVASVDIVCKLMSQLKPSPGRMEIVAQQPCVIVDYAHTPDALENVLQTSKALKPQQLWVVFGCGGDRDKTKRPLMGAIASEYAHKIVLTNDNPRNEDPTQIIQDILQGIPADHSKKVMPDRREAIRYALTHAGKDDIILIAGKGHENYQIVGSQRFAFSDQEIVKAWVQVGFP